MKLLQTDNRSLRLRTRTASGSAIATLPDSPESSRISLTATVANPEIATTANYGPTAVVGNVDSPM